MTYSQEPDPVVWAAAASGDAVAFGELYERHVQAVRAYLLRRTADPSVAEDLAQLAFLETWPVMARQSLQGETARPFLLGVATNLLRRHWRSRRRHAEALRRLHAVGDRSVAGPEEQALQQADALERVQAARAALSGLSRREMDVVALVAWEGLTYEQTAHALGIPIGTVRSRMFSARRRLAGSAAAEHLLAVSATSVHANLGVSS